MGQWLLEWITSGAILILALYLAGPALHLIRNRQLRRALHRRILAGKLNPNGFEARLALGEIHVESHRWGKAVTELAEAIRIDENHAHSRCLLGKALFHLGRAEEAARHLEVGLSIREDHGYGWTHLLLGRCYDTLGDREKAIEWYRAASRRNRSLGEPYYRLALALQATGDGEGSRAELRNAINAFSRYDKRNYWRNLWWATLARARLGWPLERVS